VQTSGPKETSNRLRVQAITPRRVIHARLKPEFKREPYQQISEATGVRLKTTHNRGCAIATARNFMATLVV
jgi:hypothetical protein